MGADVGAMLWFPNEGRNSVPASQESIDTKTEEGELLLSVAVRLNRTESMILSKLDIPLTFRQYRTLTRVAGGCTSPSQLAAISNLSLQSTALQASQQVFAQVKSMSLFNYIK